jgi:hypothetical protein
MPFPVSKINAGASAPRARHNQADRSKSVFGAALEFKKLGAIKRAA